jgi:hypothetical protein
MFFRSLFYERTILKHLERVEQLPAEVQTEIAMRVGNLVELARPVGDALLERFAEIARQEQLLAVKGGAKSDTEPQWAAPAISEAWCNARLGLAKGSLNRHRAVAIIAAVESLYQEEGFGPSPLGLIMPAKDLSPRFLSLGTVGGQCEDRFQSNLGTGKPP